MNEKAEVASGMRKMGAAAVADTPPIVQMTQRIHEAASQFDDLFNSADRVADRVRGEVPEKTSDPRATPVPMASGGQMMELESAVLRLESLVRRGEYVTSRVCEIG